MFNTQQYLLLIKFTILQMMGELRAYLQLSRPSRILDRCNRLANRQLRVLADTLATQVRQLQFTVLPLVFFQTSLWADTMMCRISSLWRSPFKKGTPRKDVVMEDITGYGPILFRSSNMTVAIQKLETYSN